MGHKLSNDVSNAFIRHLDRILFNSEINCIVFGKDAKIMKFCNSARILTSLWKTEKRVFFCGIWDDWASNSDMTVILQIFGLWTLKKIQKKFFFIFMNFSWRYGTRKAKNPVFLTKNWKTGFFSEVHPIFGTFFEVMHSRKAKNGPKLMKIYFSRL